MSATTEQITLGGLPIEKWMGRIIRSRRPKGRNKHNFIKAKLISVNERTGIAVIIPCGHYREETQHFSTLLPCWPKNTDLQHEARVADPLGQLAGEREEAEEETFPTIPNEPQAMIQSVQNPPVSEPQAAPHKDVTISIQHVKLEDIQLVQIYVTDFLEAQKQHQDAEAALKLKTEALTSRRRDLIALGVTINNDTPPPRTAHSETARQPPRAPYGIRTRRAWRNRARTQDRLLGNGIW